MSEYLKDIPEEDLKPPEYYPIEYALMWVAYGDKPINLDYAKISYPKPPVSMSSETLKSAERKLLTYLRSGKIKSQSMRYKKTKDDKYIKTGKFDPLEKEIWKNNFNWFELALMFSDKKEKYFEHTDIKLNTEDLMKCTPIEGAKDEGTKNHKACKATEKPVGSKERDTLLKLIIGMAVKGYAYDPKALKNLAVKEITDDLASLGITLDSDTVRKWIKEAAELLPRDSL